jgi:hypothetical protein
MMDDVRDLGVDAEQAELRALVWAALSGLNPGEREIIELNLRHELDGADLADTLGVPRNQAHALASRARAQFETSLGVLLVARTGREYCADLAAILDGWDGALTVLIRKRVNRHIDRCEVCGERKRRELSPAMLLSLLPVAMIPAGLRQQIFHLVSDDSPGAATYRAWVAHRAEPFGPGGFPLQVAKPSAARWPGNYALAAVAVVAVLALLSGGGVFFADFVTHGGSPAAAGTPAQPESAGSSGSVGALVVTPSLSPSAKSPKPSPKTGFPAPILTAPIPVVVPPPPAPVAPPSAPRTTRPAPAPSTTPPSTTRTTPPPPPPPATLTETPATVQLQPDATGLPTGSFTLTAANGTVDYSIGVPAGLTVSTANGSLAAGQSVTVTIGVAAGAALTQPAIITVTPTSPAAAAISVTVDPPPAPAISVAARGS